MKSNCLVRLKSTFALASLALIACAGCAAQTEAGEERTASIPQAITNGDVDNDDPAVVALMLDGNVYCTGVLLTKAVVATAAHCVSPTPPDFVFFGSRPSTKKGTFIAVSDTKAHPDFDEDTLENDIAMVGLADEAPVAPLPILVGEFDASFKGRDIRLVGFGVPSASSDGLRKRTGDSSIVSFTDSDFRFQAAPSQTCNGDSGGPALAMIGGKETVIGIASSGDSDCVTYGRNMRIDAFLPFLKSYAKAYAAKRSAAADESRGCSIANGTARSRSSGSALLFFSFFALACVAVARVRRRAHGAGLNGTCR